MEKGRSRAYIACHIGSENIHWGKEAQRDFEFITMAFVEGGNFALEWESYYQFVTVQFAP